jgi:hypothetical protein
MESYIRGLELAEIDFHLFLSTLLSSRLSVIPFRVKCLTFELFGRNAVQTGRFSGTPNGNLQVVLYTKKKKKKKKTNIGIHVRACIFE